MAQYASGYIEGGAATNVECGFWPDHVRVMNLSDRDHVYEAHLAPIIEFDGGGGAGLEIRAGDNIQAADAGWSGVVKEVVLVSGTWAGGDAVGFLVLVPGSLTGAANVADDDNIAVSRQKGGAYSGNYATVNDADGLFEATIDVATTVQAAAANQEIVLYAPDDANSRGFTTGSAIGAASELLYWQAWGEGVG